MQCRIRVTADRGPTPVERPKVIHTSRIFRKALGIFLQKIRTILYY